jgi:transposase
MTVPGVNLICAATLIAAVGDANRFLSSRKLVAYLGLHPRVKQSGEGPARSGRISNRGSASATWALVEAAWTAVLAPGPCTRSTSEPRAGAVTANRSSRQPASSRSCSHTKPSS